MFSLMVNGWFAQGTASDQEQLVVVRQGRKPANGQHKFVSRAQILFPLKGFPFVGSRASTGLEL